MGRIDRLIGLVWSNPKRATFTSVLIMAALGVVMVAIPAVGEAAKWLMVASPIALLAGAFPNQTKQVASRVLEQAAHVSRRAERQAIKQDLEGTLSLGAARLGELAPHRVLAPLRIDYLRSGEEVSSLPDGTVVVGIVSHSNRDRNLAAAAWTYVRHGVLADARPYVDPEVCVGLDGVLTKEMLAVAGSGAVREFLTSIWRPTVLGKPRVAQLSEKLDRLQADKLLGPIVLSEFQDLALSLGFRMPTTAIARETADFVDYLYELALREPGEDVGDQVNFEGAAIRCRVLFVGRPDVYSVKGPNPYRKAVDWAIRRAYHRVYLLGLGARGQDYVQEVAAPYRTDARIEAVEAFSGERRYASGRILRQAVVRISVNVRYQVGIGQRPMVAVGPGTMTPAEPKVRVG